MINEDQLTAGQYVFSSSGASQAMAPALRFERNGRIGGYQHPNEFAWQVINDKLVIRCADGRVSCVADPVMEQDGNIAYVGKFLLNPGIVHTFTPRKGGSLRHAIYTFDLFDTLVFRKCCEPKEVFVAVGKILAIEQFLAIRTQAEAKLWHTGDYSFDDIYRQLALDTGWPTKLIDDIKALELNLEWENICPIQEMVQRVRDGDAVVTDMYLPYEFIKKIVVEKCGLENAPIYLSSHGKFNGSIWEKIHQNYDIKRHYGDNVHSDIEVARKSGIDAEYVGMSQRTVGEKVLALLGLGRISNLLREIRLTYYEKDPILYGACMAQLEVNIPLLIVASFSVLKVAADKKVDTILMCSRDCNLWVHLIEWVALLFPVAPEIKYFTASRILYLAGGENYRKYYDQVSGKINLMVDVSGTARSPSFFIGNEGLQDNCIIYLLAYSRLVSNFMGNMAPERDDVSMFHLSEQPAHSSRIVIEAMNMALENRSIGFEEVGGQLRPIVEDTEFTGIPAAMLSEMRSLFMIVVDTLKESGIQENPQKLNDSDLSAAADILIAYGLKYYRNLSPVIDAVNDQEVHVQEIVQAQRLMLCD